MQIRQETGRRSISPLFVGPDVHEDPLRIATAAAPREQGSPLGGLCNRDLI
jgi:hypothetical protein